MPITQQQFDALGTKIENIGKELSKLIDLYAKVKRRVNDPDFPQTLDQLGDEVTNKYMQRRALVIAAANDLPQV